MGVFFFFLLFSSFFSPVNWQSFLLHQEAPADVPRGERHPQRHRLGTPVRGGDLKRQGKGGKGTWGALGDDGSETIMRNGALDRRDPNYSSGSSSDDEHSSSSSQASSLGRAEAHAATSYPPRQFKRIELDQLFESAGAKPSSSSSNANGGKKKKKGKNKAKNNDSDKHAGGAHLTNMPDAQALPMPSSLTSTPSKPRR